MKILHFAFRLLPGMEEKKYNTAGGDIVLVRDMDPERLAGLQMAGGLGIFFHYRYEEASKTKEVLLGLCGSCRCKVTAAVDDSTLVGYVTIVPPADGSRWEKLDRELSSLIVDSESPFVCELGSIEVGKNYRGLGVATALLEFTFDDPSFDRRIVFLRELSWHWDIRASGLSVLEYRNMLFRMFERAGFGYCTTDDDEVSYSGANMFMVRVGRDVPMEVAMKFYRMLCRSEPKGWGWGF